MAFVPNRPFAHAWGGASGKRVRRSSGELLRRCFSRWAEKVGRRRLDGDGIGGEAMRAALTENRGEKDDDAGTVIIQNFHREYGYRKQRREGWKRIRFTDTDSNMSDNHICISFRFPSFKMETDQIRTDTNSDISDILGYPFSCLLTVSIPLGSSCLPACSWPRRLLACGGSRQEILLRRPGGGRSCALLARGLVVCCCCCHRWLLRNARTSCHLLSKHCPNQTQNHRQPMTKVVDGS